MIKKLGRILTYVITFIGGFIAAIVALFKLAGKVLDTKSQFGWNGITTLKNYICDQFETLFFGQPRNSRSGSYYNYTPPRYTSYLKNHWINPHFETKKEAEDFLTCLLQDCEYHPDKITVDDVVDVLDSLGIKLTGAPHDYEFLHGYGWTLFQIKAAKPVYMNITGSWTVTLPQPQRL
jgi:hypothetical protein